MGDLRDVGEAERVDPVERLHREQRQLAGDASQHPQPHRRGDRRGGQHVGRQGGRGELVKGVGHQRSGRHRRRGRHSDRLGQGAASGLRSVPPAIAAASRLAQSMIPITAAKLSCQPTSRSAQGLIARVIAAASRTAYQRDREAVGQRRDQAGGPHDAGSLDRRARSSDRHVDRDQAECADQPRSQRQPEQRQKRPGQDAEQDHVLAADREQVGQIGALEFLASPLIDPVVLPEDETARERGFPLGHAATESLLRALSDRSIQPVRPPRRPGRDSIRSVRRVIAMPRRRRYAARHGSGVSSVPSARISDPTGRSPSGSGATTRTRPSGESSRRSTSRRSAAAPRPRSHPP